MKTRNFILLVLFVLLNVQVNAQTLLTRNGKLTSTTAEAVSINGAIGAASGIGRDGKILTAVTPVSEVTNPTTGAIWLDRNLGASQVAASSTDADAYGDLYQWGRSADGHQIRTSETTSTNATSSAPTTGTDWYGKFITEGSSPYDWRSTQNNNLWYGVSGTNNPCPSGFRLPTEAEWTAERTSWSTNNAAGALASPLKLPMADFRRRSGSLGGESHSGNYWSSTVEDANSLLLYFYSYSADVDSDYRAGGASVRCLKD